MTASKYECRLRPGAPPLAKRPMLTSGRLALRPLILDDAPRIAELAGDWRVADTTARIPHPYPPDAAERWIRQLAVDYNKGAGIVFGITLKSDDQLIGTIGLELDPTNHKAELGYWIGVPYWSKGYATEAAWTVTRFAFEELCLQRLMVCCFARNRPSARIIEKLGFRKEGLLLRHILRWGEYEDVEYHAMLRTEYDAWRDEITNRLEGFKHA